jgi:Tol biopolymer transport system component
MISRARSNPESLAPGYDHLVLRPPYLLDRPLLILTLIAAVAITAACKNGDEAPSPVEHIAFLSDRDGNEDVFVMNADASELTNVSNTPADEIAFAWSPDGSRIAIISGSEGDTGNSSDVEGKLYSVNTEGRDLIQVADGAAEDSPAWSPDGSRLAFTSHREGNNEIYVVNADGSGATNITQNDADDHAPIWSRDGLQIAFLSASEDGQEDLYTMNADGSDRRNLTRHPAEYCCAIWSPDGSRIAFTSNQDGGFDSDIYIMNSDGSGVVRLTDGPGDKRDPAWSPDSSRIAFESVRDEPSGYVADVYMAKPDGSQLINLTDDPSADGDREYEYHPSWSPDASRLVFHRVPDGGRFPGIYVINADGSAATAVFDDSGYDWRPAWAPAP